MGSQVDETEAITDSWQAARQVQKSLAYQGWNHVAFPEDLQGDHRLALDMTVVDRFAEAVSRKEEEAAVAERRRIRDLYQDIPSYLPQPCVKPFHQPPADIRQILLI